MKEIANFFWQRWHRAMTLDEVARLQGKPTPNRMECLNWVDAYKQTLSNSKKSEFDKEWNKLEKQLEDWYNANPNKQKNMVSPLL